jgi:23S rRNA (cytidine1920-2'-O)/16S rRNA (cytidine1409-2'-O)-methyltransferase
MESGRDSELTQGDSRIETKCADLFTCADRLTPHATGGFPRDSYMTDHRAMKAEGALPAITRASRASRQNRIEPRQIACSARPWRFPSRASRQNRVEARPIVTSGRPWRFPSRDSRQNRIEAGLIAGPTRASRGPGVSVACQSTSRVEAGVAAGLGVLCRVTVDKTGQDGARRHAGESPCSALCHDTFVRSTVTRNPRARLDELLVDRGLAETRSKAQALILAGKVRVGDGDAARRDHKPGDTVDPATTIDVAEKDRYVSRGGHKLAAALDAFDIDPEGTTALDVGASTGGFSDVLLQRGARHVYALDVGRGQLAESLRRDDRVTSLERTNARTLTEKTLPEPIDLAVIDVSFISLDKVLGPVLTALAPKAHIVALVKPQFEAGKGRTDKGVVRDPAIHREVLERVTAHARTLGLGTRDVIASPILGPEGNKEFLVHLAQGPSCADLPMRIATVTGT